MSRQLWDQQPHKITVWSGNALVSCMSPDGKSNDILSGATYGSITTAHHPMA
jgi:hypothetical protein